MVPLSHVSDSNLVATAAAAISVLGYHTHTAGKFPRREFGAAYLQATEDARSGQRRDMAGPELETLLHTYSTPSNTVGCASQVPSPPLMVRQNLEWWLQLMG